jgi:hypothetical protein
MMRYPPGVYTSICASEFCNNTSGLPMWLQPAITVAKPATSKSVAVVLG